jgi:hypothetical protein
VTPGAPGAGTRAGPVAVLLPSAPTLGASPRVCLDCGTPLGGKYCTVCGQKDEPLKRGLGDLAREFLQHPLIDTKLWRSLVPLLLRPGALTEEYLAGRRTRYVRPLKLYLTISVVFFALLVVRTPADTVLVQFDETSPAKAVANTSPPERKPFPIRWLDERMERRTAGLDAAGRAALAKSMTLKILERIPRMVFVFLPLTAVLLKLFYWKRYFVEHLVFTLHLHSFSFAAGLVIFTYWVPVIVVFGVWSSVYTVLAFKRVYRDRWGKTLAKLTGVLIAYYVLFVVAMLVTSLSILLTA